MKKISFCHYGLVSKLPEKKHPRNSRNSKTICPTSHMYGPVSWLLEVIIPLLERGDIVGEHHVPSCCFTGITTGNI